MGYRPKRKQYKLIFTDPDMAGLEVIATGMRMEMLIRSAGLSGRSAEEVGQDSAAVDVLFSGFAATLVSWNVEDDNGVPVPATKEGLYTQELAFVLEIIGAWTSAVASVPENLSGGSTPGVQSLAASIPMETLSPSLVS